MDGSEEIFEFSPVIDKGQREGEGVVELEHVNKREETKEEGGGREERIGTIPLTGAHIPHREGPEGKGAQVPALPCVSLWDPLLARLPPKQGQDPRREWVGAREEGGQRERERDRGACSVPIF